ncbi:MAG: AIPR family protein [[Ruminococcus] gnavus]|nr:AIPR family protein [Mediterraneibacter gnavus]
MANEQLSNSQILIKECVAQEYAEAASFENEAAYFEYFAAAQVLKDYDLSDEEIESGIIGAGNDGGCDAMYIFLNKNLILPDQIETIRISKESSVEVIIIQAKRENSFREDAIMKWKTVSDNLLQLSNSLEDFKTRYNEDVLELFRTFRDLHTKLIRNRVKLKFKFCYVSYAVECHPNVKQQAKELEMIVKRNYPSSMVYVDFIGADELFEKYNSLSETVVNLPLVEIPIGLGKNKDYVTLVSLAEYFKFITDENLGLRKRFFEANVRDYQGKNAVNSCIRDSLEDRDSEEDFWWLNNGITILASEAIMANNRELQLTNPEIVNGLQTSNEIYNYYSQNVALLENEKRNILVRIIVPETEKVRDDIIFATNNQTNIPKSSLRVTDSIHLEIEMYFKSRGLYYDRRKNYYKNQGKKAKDIVGVSFLGQCLITLFLQKPDFARARPSTLLTDDETYAKLYEDNKDLEVFYKCALIGKLIQRNLKIESGYTASERSDILFYLIYGVVADILRKKDISPKDIKEIEIEDITEDRIREVRDKIYVEYKKQGGNSHVAKSTMFINTVNKALMIELKSEKI